MTNDELVTFFRQRSRNGVVSLLSFLVEKGDGGKSPIEFGLTDVLDNDRMLDQITLLMSRFGFEHAPAHFESKGRGGKDEWRKSMRLYCRKGRFGAEADIDTLGWFARFSEIVDQLHASTIDRFDALCASMAGTATGPQTESALENL